MPIQPEVAIPKIVRGLASATIDAQREMNAEWLERMAEYQPILDEAARQGFARLGQALAPSRMQVESAEIDVGMFVRQEKTGGLRARLFSLGMLRRQRSIDSVNVRMRCEIRQTAICPKTATMEG
jgi:hypothetical protein